MNSSSYTVNAAQAGDILGRNGQNELVRVVGQGHFGRAGQQFTNHLSPGEIFRAGQGTQNGLDLINLWPFQLVTDIGHKLQGIQEDGVAQFFEKKFGGLVDLEIDGCFVGQYGGQGFGLVSAGRRGGHEV